MDDTPGGRQITHQLRVELRFLPERVKERLTPKLPPSLRFAALCTEDVCQ
jgi:hypothetical protein